MERNTCGGNLKKKKGGKGAKMGFFDGYTEKGKRTVLDAVIANMHPIEHMFPTRMSEREYEAFKLAERQHAPGVACRMNPRTFRVEYYNEKTGEIVN